MAKYGDSLYPTDCCLICKNEIDLVRHEVFHGPNRQKSKEYGCWVTLCPRCHIDLHDHPAKYRWLQSDTQQLAMDAYGWSEEDFRNQYDSLKAADVDVNIKKYYPSRSKGSMICCEGRIENNPYEDKNGNKRDSWSVNVSSVHFCGGKAESEERFTPVNVQFEELEDGELPF